MRIAAKFNGTCRLCQTKVRKGEEVDFESGTGITACPVCREFPESGVEVELCAQITQIKHQSERSNWGVVKARVTEVIRSDCTDEQAHLTAPGRLYSVAGPVGIPVEGEESIVRGRLILDPKWGMQIKLSAPLESRGITSLPALRAYLDMAPNIGPARTEEIIRLGKHDLSRVYALLGPDWEQLVKVKGITRESAEEIHAWYERTLANRGAIQFLSAMELPQNVQRAALAEWRANTETVIRRDPFVLMRLSGCGFKTADAVATHVGIGHSDPRRVAAAVLHILQRAAEDGHTYLARDIISGQARAPRFSATESAVNDVGLSGGELSGALVHALELAPVKIVEHDGDVALESLRVAEARIADALMAIDSNDVPNLQLPENISTLFGGLTPAPEQANACRVIAERSVVVLTGGPGCLSGSTELLIESDARRGRGGRPCRLVDLYYKFHKILRRGKSKNKFWSGGVRTLSLFPDGGVNYNTIEDVLYNGVREVFELRTSNGRVVRATADHLIRVPDTALNADTDGYCRLDALRIGDPIVVRREATAPPAGSTQKDRTNRAMMHVPLHPFAVTKRVKARIGGGRVRTYTYKLVLTSRLAVEAAVNKMSLQQFVRILRGKTQLRGLWFCPSGHEVHHLDGNVQNNRADNLAVLTKSSHAQVHGVENRKHFGNQLPEQDVIVSITPVGAEPVYDLVMAEPSRNYVAGGVVVHNCGKTQTTRAVIKLFHDNGLTVFSVAPTGRAALRLAELTGHPAATIHRQIAIKPGVAPDEFTLGCDAIVCDESSMIDVELAAQLLAVIDTERPVRLVFVGDVDQLPPVGAGAFFKDLIDSERVPVVRLTQIFRQAGDSPIPHIARAFNEGAMPSLERSDGFAFINTAREDAEEAAQLAQDTIVMAATKWLIEKERGGAKSIADIAVVAPQRTGLCGVRALNERISAIVNAGKSPAQTLPYGDGAYFEGDKVMHTVNNYELNVFNGEIGTIACVSESGEAADRFAAATGYEVTREDAKTAVVVEYAAPGVPGNKRFVGYSRSGMHQLTLAYAITTHKMQGSSAPCVIFAATAQHRWMLSRRLIYTTVTRAERYLLIVGDAAVIRRAVAAQSNDAPRNTRLRGLLTPPARTAKDWFDSLDVV